MRSVFADTSFYIAFVNPYDSAHVTATEFVRHFSGKSVTTEYVLVEVGNWLARSGDRPVFLDLLNNLRADPDTAVLAGDHALFEAGLNLYSKRLDKDWSLTDCISFVVMKRLKLMEVLTADHHFEQAGFKVLLK
jgi:uncharacterized protein